MSAAGRRLLVVEDSYLVGCDLRRQLERMGHEVVGPVPTCAKAIELIESDHEIDGGVLDIALARGATSEPVARRLSERGVPFLFMTGHANEDTLPEDLQSRPRLLKPIDPTELRDAVAGLG